MLKKWNAKIICDVINGFIHNQQLKGIAFDTQIIISLCCSGVPSFIFALILPLLDEWQLPHAFLSL